MDIKKALFGLLILIALCWWLYPKRELAAPPAKTNVIEIAYMGPGGPAAGALADVMQEFERESERANAQDPTKPIYRVISGQTASADQTADPTRFLVSLAGGSPPDVIRFDRYAVAEWAARGAFTPLDDFIARDRAAGRPDTPKSDDYYKAAWDEAMYGGKLFGIPNTIDNRTLTYNKDLLRRANLVDKNGEPVPPRTWSQLLDYNRKLTIVERKSDKSQMTLEAYFDSIKPKDTTNWKPRLDNSSYKLITVGFIPMYGNAFLYMLSWCNGGEFVDPNDPTKITLNDPKNIEALEFAKQIYDELGGFESVQGFQAGFQSGALNPFITSQVALKLDGFWSLNNLGQFGRDIDFGCSPPPVSDRMFAEGRDKVSWTGGWAYAIPTTSKNKDAAWELIRFISTDRAWKIMIAQDIENAAAEGRILFPNQLAKKQINEWQYENYIYSNPSIAPKYIAGLRAYNDLLDYSRFRPITPVGQLLWNEHMSKADRALYGRATPKQALDDGNAIVQRALDRVIKPTPGRPIHSWTWFLILYGSLILIVMIGIYFWDTKVAFRSKLGRLIGLNRAQREAVVAGSNGSYMKRQWIGGWICASPWIIGFIIFGGGPMLFSFIISFCRYDIINPAQ
ncbi:MAG TPA: extracellular solute-binding protein, partial [Tepidisphaeraceae bacterium]|nr:extracellular solute-binding protein [Tepidisphaeraceae bacterium]